MDRDDNRLICIWPVSAGIIRVIRSTKPFIIRLLSEDRFEEFALGSG